MDDSKQAIAAERFLEEYDFIKRFAFRCAPDRSVKEEIVNEVFAVFVSGADRWDLNEDVRPVLVCLIRTTAARLWREHYRGSPEKLRQIAELLNQRSQANFTPENPVDDEIVREEFFIGPCMEKLPPKSQTLLQMHYWQRISLVHIADILNVKASTIRQAIVRVRAKLRRCIEFSKKNEFTTMEYDKIHLFGDRSDGRSLREGEQE